MGNDIETGRRKEYSANLPGFNNLEENRKGKQMQLKVVLPSTGWLKSTPTTGSDVITP